MLFTMMRKKYPAALAMTLLLGTVTGTAAAQTPSRVQETLTVNEVPELRGYFGERWEANRDGSLHGFDIERYVRLVEDRNHRAWWWAGEQDGKWLESAVLSSAHSDPELRDKAKSILNRIIASQEASGYVGVTPADIRTPQKPLRGMDPYECYFRLHALITAYEQWDDEAALDAARKFGDYLVNTIGPGKAEFWPSNLRAPENRGKVLQGQSDIAGHAVHYSWEGTMLIDPMLRLALVTEDDRYLEWSKWVVDNIDRWSGWDSFSRLEDVAKGKIGVHELQPYVHSHTFHMNFLGFLRLYEITGDESYLRKVAGAWDDVTQRQMYITGGVSVGEHYTAEKVRPLTGHVVETCATMSWLQITQYLLELTGDIKYADAMERLLWNHVFASQAIDGDTYRYHTPPNGVKPRGLYHGPNCCTSSGHRMVSLLPTFLYGKDKDGVFINQYAASTVETELSNGQSIRIKQDTDYPQSTKISILIESAPKDAMTIRLRVPGWCKKPSVRLNGEPIRSVKTNSYLEIKRLWSNGDVIELDFPMDLEWVRSDAKWNTSIRRLPGGEMIHEPIPNSPAPYALRRGPVVYAIDTMWWDDKQVSPPANVGNNLAVVPDLNELKEVDTPKGLKGPVYETSFVTISGEEVRAKMVPFTNIGHWYQEGEPKPDRHAAVNSYAIWLQSPDSPLFKERIQMSKEEQERLANAIDYVKIGNQDSEEAHGVEGGNTGIFREKPYRHGNTFSYELKVATERDSKLIVTYWGSDDGREFDVKINDRIVGTTKLSNNKPDEFFEVTYEIPVELIAGKTNAFGQKLDKVRISFVTKNNRVAGGVFGIRVE